MNNDMRGKKEVVEGNERMGKEKTVHAAYPRVHF